MNNEGDDTPHVIVKLRPGKSEQQKRRLTQAITKAVILRRYLPDLINRVLSCRMNPGKLFDLTLPL